MEKDIFYYKALVLRDDKNQLMDNLEKRLHFALERGKKAFNGGKVRVVDVCGPFHFGWVAIYRIERITVSMCEGNGIKKETEN